MYKYSITLLLIVGLGFSYGVRPAFDFGFRYTNIKMSYEDMDASTDYLALTIGTSVPYSKIVGLYVELAAITFYDGNLTNLNFCGGGSSPYFTFSGIGSKIGLVEMIPAQSVSPYFKQYIMLDRWSSDFYSYTFYALGFSTGAEFFTPTNISLLFEGFASYGSLNEDDFYTDANMGIFNFGFTFSVRLSLKTSPEVQ